MQVGDCIYLHGSVSSTTLKNMKKGCDVCLTGEPSLRLHGALQQLQALNPVGRSHTPGWPGPGALWVPSQASTSSMSLCVPLRLQH